VPTPAEQSAIAQFLAAVGALAGMSRQRLAALLRNTPLSQIVDALPWSSFGRELQALQQTMLDQATTAAMRSASGLGVQVGTAFDLVDQRALEWAEQRVGNLIVQVTEEQRQAVRAVVDQALRGGGTVDDVAGALSRTIGLHDRYAMAVENSYQGTLSRLMAEGATRAQAEAAAQRVADAYRQRLLQARARTVARTEILSAQNAGRQLGWADAIEQGFADPNSTKVWVVDDPCDICEELDGEEVGWDEDFSNGESMPPAHPNCECTAILVTRTGEEIEEA